MLEDLGWDLLMVAGPAATTYVVRHQPRLGIAAGGVLMLVSLWFSTTVPWGAAPGLGIIGYMVFGFAAFMTACAFFYGFSTAWGSMNTLYPPQRELDLRGVADDYLRGSVICPHCGQPGFVRLPSWLSSALLPLACGWCRRLAGRGGSYAAVLAFLFASSPTRGQWEPKQLLAALGAAAFVLAIGSLLRLKQVSPQAAAQARVVTAVAVGVWAVLLYLSFKPG